MTKPISTDLTIDELNTLIDQIDLPANVKSKLGTNPFMLQQVMTALGLIQFKAIEGNRIYAFLLIVDRSSSVWNFAEPLLNCIRGTYGRLKEIQTTGSLVGGALAITDMSTAGCEVMIPFQNIQAINTDDLTFEPSGYTPLYDALVIALIALRVLVKMAAQAGKQLTPLAYLVSDGSDEGLNGRPGSKTFDVNDAHDMVVAITTGRRKGRVAAVSVGTTLQRLFDQIGIRPGPPARSGPPRMNWTACSRR